MKIKDAEKLTGIPSANIRFYEKEGLLLPGRNSQNNYREYDEETIERLNQIKIFRALGIPVEDIKMIFHNKRSVESVIQDRLNTINAEEIQLKEIRAVCERILRDGAKLESLDESVFEESADIWRKHLGEIFALEMVEVNLSVRQMHCHMTILLVAGYFLHLIVTLVFLKCMTLNPASGETSGIVIWFMILLLVFASIATYWSGSIKVHAVILALVSVFWPVLLQMVIYELTYFAYIKLYRELAFGIPLIQMYLIIYTLCLWWISEKRADWIKKEWHTMLLAVSGSGVLGMILKLSTGNGFPVFVMALMSSLYVGIYWTSVIKDVYVYNRYYAVASVNRLLNPIAVIFHYRGRHATTLWR